MTTTKMKMEMMEQSGATDQQVPRWNNSTSQYEPADSEASQILAINNQTGTTYTLVLDDQYVRISNAGAIALTVPSNSSVAYTIGTQILIRQTGVGQVTVTEDAGVTINTADTLLLRAEKSTAALIKVATDEWDLTGDLEV